MPYRLRVAGAHEEEGDVGHEEDNHEEEQLPHDARKVVTGREGGKVGAAARFVLHRAPAHCMLTAPRRQRISAMTTGVAAQQQSSERYAADYERPCHTMQCDGARSSAVELQRRAAPCR